MLANKRTIEHAIAATYHQRTPGWKRRIEILEDLLANPDKGEFWRQTMLSRHKPYLIADRGQRV